MHIMTVGSEFWEIESDELVSVFEEIANEHAAHWEEIVDGLAQDEIPPPPATPWETLEAALRASEDSIVGVVGLYDLRPQNATAATVRPVARAS